MGYRRGNSSDWEDYYKSLMAEQYNIASYEQLWKNRTSDAITAYTQPLASAYRTSQSNLNQGASKNISQAYSNYLTSKLTMRTAENIGSGSKAAYLYNAKHQTQNNINQAYNELEAQQKELDAQYASNLASATAQATSDVAKEQAETNKQINKLATNAMKYSKDMLRAGYESGNFDELFDENGKLRDDVYAKMYSLNDGYETLTDYGKQVLTQFNYYFDDWAQEHYDDAAWNDYVNNGDSFRQGLFGSAIPEYDPANNEVIKQTARQTHLESAAAEASVLAGITDNENAIKAVESEYTEDQLNKLGQRWWIFEAYRDNILIDNGYVDKSNVSNELKTLLSELNTSFGEMYSLFANSETNSTLNWIESNKPELYDELKQFYKTTKKEVKAMETDIANRTKQIHKLRAEGKIENYQVIDLGYGIYMFYNNYGKSEYFNKNKK